MKEDDPIGSEKAIRAAVGTTLLTTDHVRFIYFSFFGGQREKVKESRDAAFERAPPPYKKMSAAKFPIKLLRKIKIKFS